MKHTALSKAVVAASAIALAGMHTASAEITFVAGNIQYDNVNFVAATSGASVVGDIGATTRHVTFLDMVLGSNPIDMHAQHGVAFIESLHDSTTTPHTGFTSLSFVPETGFFFTAGDFKIDLLADPDNDHASHSVFFDVVYSGTPGSTTHFELPAVHGGQNPYNFATSAGEMITRVTMSVGSGYYMEDLKQVSLDIQPVPEASTVGAMVAMAGMAGFVGWRRAKARRNAQ